MSINYSAMTRAISDSDIQELRSIPEYARTFWSSNKFGAIIGAAAMAGLLIGPLVMPVLEGTATFQVLASCLIAIGVSAIIGPFVMQYIRRRDDLRLYRFVYFAKENGFVYQQKESTSPQPGLIFQEGHSHRFGNVISGVTSNTPFEMGNFFYITGSGKNQQSHDWGYVAIPLKRQVPNMILDAKSNDIGMFGLGITNLPTAFKGNQTLSLEGDFDKYFTLYAPKEYERDALYVFTPDLMALLIDNTATFDIETVDNKLYIYSSKQLNLLDPTLLEKLFQIIGTVGTKTVSQTAAYADERAVGPAQGSVAEPGRRLKTSYTRTIIIVASFIVLYMLLVIF